MLGLQYLRFSNNKGKQQRAQTILRFQIAEHECNKSGVLIHYVSALGSAY